MVKFSYLCIVAVIRSLAAECASGSCIEGALQNHSEDDVSIQMLQHKASKTAQADAQEEEKSNDTHFGQDETDVQEFLSIGGEGDTGCKDGYYKFSGGECVPISTGCCDLFNTMCCGILKGTIKEEDHTIGKPIGECVYRHGFFKNNHCHPHGDQWLQLPTIAGQKCEFGYKCCGTPGCSTPGCNTRACTPWR